MQNQAIVAQSKLAKAPDVVAARLPSGPYGLLRLANMQGFAELVSRELGSARRFGTRPALLLIDVEVREPLGGPVLHEPRASDVVEALGARLRSRVRGSDVVAKVGELRFGLVLQNVERANVHVIQHRLQRVLSGAYELGPHPLYASVVSGVVKCECSNIGGGELIRSAEAALSRYAPEAARLGAEGRQLPAQRAIAVRPSGPARSN